jgi:hypothetical protein
MKKLVLIVISLSMVLFACKPVSTKKSVEAPVAIKKKQIEIYRYEKAIFSLDVNNLASSLSKLSPRYDFFLGNDWQDTMNILRMYNFVSDKNIRGLYFLVTQRFPDTVQLQKDLKQAFDQVEKFYPEIKFPIVFTYVSGLDIELPVIYADTVMAISLDLFLGSDVLAYREAGVPEYKYLRFTKEFILPESMLAVADSLIKRDESNQSLLYQMVAAGKALYFLDVVLPGVKDEFKIGYSPEKLKWCSDNEGNTWAFLIGNQLLYSSDPQVGGKLMVDAPFTSGFVKESPGRLGEWVGWQIVRAYMKENSNVTLPELMKNTDAQSILEGSKYKPLK